MNTLKFVERAKHVINILKSDKIKNKGNVSVSSIRIISQSSSAINVTTQKTFAIKIKE